MKVFIDKHTKSTGVSGQVGTLHHGPEVIRLVDVKVEDGKLVAGTPVREGNTRYETAAQANYDYVCNNLGGDGREIVFEVAVDPDYGNKLISQYGKTYELNWPDIEDADFIKKYEIKAINPLDGFCENMTEVCSNNLINHLAEIYGFSKYSYSSHDLEIVQKETPIYTWHLSGKKSWVYFVTRLT